MKQVVRDNPDSYSASNVCGRTKLVEYNGTKLNGGWELLVAKWLDGQGIEWTNKIAPIEYEWKGNTHLYFPDFYLPKYDRYIEVKGYERERDVAKWKSIPNLIILKVSSINRIKNEQLTIQDVL